MKTVFIIGNGFDLNIGLKTRYSDFYKYYCKTPSNDKIIANLKKSIDSANLEGDYTNWSDLEIAFGKYTKEIKDAIQFDILLTDIVNNLATYLQEQENDFIPNDRQLVRLIEWLAYPEAFLLPADDEEVKSFKSNFINNNNYVNIITLNYTRIIEKMLDIDVSDKLDIVLNKNNPDPTITLRRIDHIHGYLNNRMILGVNDVSQISNKSFHDNDDILESIIKQKFNETCKHTIDRVCADNIKAAKLICIFGCSLGATDTIWWNLIGEQLKRDCRLIIFSRSQDFDPRFASQVGRLRRATQKSFLDRTSLSDEEKIKVLPNIYVGSNVDLFPKT